MRHGFPGLKPKAGEARLWGDGTFRAWQPDSKSCDGVWRGKLWEEPRGAGASGRQVRRGRWTVARPPGLILPQPPPTPSSSSQNHWRSSALQFLTPEHMALITGRKDHPPLITQPLMATPRMINVLAGIFPPPQWLYVTKVARAHTHTLFHARAFTQVKAEATWTFQLGHPNPIISLQNYLLFPVSFMESKNFV